ncbi:MAG: hypothetical protein ACOY5Y_06940 [Pseudomonadota bacterium]
MGRPGAGRGCYPRLAPHFWRFAMTIRILIWTLCGTIVVYGFLLVMSVT